MRRLTLFALAALIALPVSADAQRPPRRRSREHSGAAATPLAAPASTEPELEPPSIATPDSDALIQVIQSAALTASAEGARSIAHLLLRGVPPRVAAAGLDALGVMARPEAAPAVLRFLRHRRALLRRHAVAAAQAIHTPDLVRALAAALGDSDPDVRVEAAIALGEVGNAEIVPGLFAAFERDLESVDAPNNGRLMHEAARAIARVGSAADVDRLLTYLRRVPFRTMADAMRAAIARTDLPEALRLRVIASVGDLATREAREFLTSIVANARGQSNAMTRAAQTAADRIAE